MTHIDKLHDISKLERVQEAVTKKLNDGLLQAEYINRELTLVVRKKELLNTLKYLRDDRRFMFKCLMDICGVDWLGKKSERFEVVYHLLSVHKNMRIRVKISLAEDESAPSAHELFDAANWFEREAYDMFGISFENHPDLRRILCDYGFDGHPLRKDFPLVGKVEAYYDKDEKRVAYKKVDMPQEFRRFDEQSPWEAMTGNATLAEDPNMFSEEEFK
jgi:NADH-quinone oxidoreductase subunit C